MSEERSICMYWNAFDATDTYLPVGFRDILTAFGCHGRSLFQDCAQSQQYDLFSQNGSKTGPRDKFLNLVSGSRQPL